MDNIFRKYFILQPIIRIMALSCTVAILYLTLMPSKGTPIETISDFTIGGDVGDAVLHFLIFVIHTSLWLLALHGWRDNRDVWRYALGLGLLLAIGTETAQIFIPTRGAILMDYTGNVMGVLVTVWLWQYRIRHLF